MSHLSLSDLGTLKGLKSFLQQYHARLSAERSFPPLNLSKALHAASPLLGAKNWHVLAAGVEAAPGPSSTCGFYQANYEDCPRGEGEAASPARIFPTLERCFEMLWDYVGDARLLTEGLIDDPCNEDFEAQLLAAAQRIQVRFEDIKWGDRASVKELLDALTLEDKIDMIEWYFDFSDDDDTSAGYFIRYHASADDADGAPVSLKALLQG